MKMTQQDLDSILQQASHPQQSKEERMEMYNRYACVYVSVWVFVCACVCISPVSWYTKIVYMCSDIYIYMSYMYVYHILVYQDHIMSYLGIPRSYVILLPVYRHDRSHLGTKPIFSTWGIWLMPI
jgi:hypothetical protein